MKVSESWNDAHCPQYFPFFYWNKIQGKETRYKDEGEGNQKKLEENTFWIYTKYTGLLGFMLIPCMSLEMKKFRKAFNVVLALKFLQRWTNSFDKIKEI